MTLNEQKSARLQMQPPPPVRVCKQCGGEFRRKLNTLYCSPACSRSAAKGLYDRFSSVPIPTGTVGAISELRIAADLLAKGYEVFRAVSSACSCDLMVLKDGVSLRIECRTGYTNKKTGKVYTSRKNKADVVAINTNIGILYEPEEVIN